MSAGAEPIVFVIDDDASLRESLSRLFRSVGLQVKSFASAPEFLQGKLPDVPSCLVLDVRLPGLRYMRMLLTHRKLLQSKAIAIENDLRGTLRNFGLKVGMVGTVKFEARIKELVENQPDLAGLVEPLLVVRRVLREQFVILHRRLLAIVRDDEVCRRLITTPGVGPVVALTYRATVDVPARFRKSKAVGAVFGLTCSKYQSGEIDRNGRISRCGDEMMRAMLYEAAQSMLRSKKWSWLKAWAMQIARRRGMKKAIVALARRLAVIMHRIWVDGTEFRWTREQAGAAA